MDCSPPGSSVHGILQGIFPTQGSNSCLLRCRQILNHSSTSRLENPMDRGAWWNILNEWKSLVLINLVSLTLVCIDKSY